MISGQSTQSKAVSPQPLKSNSMKQQNPFPYPGTTWPDVERCLPRLPSTPTVVLARPFRGPFRMK
jgi:hypothetical protein